MILRAVLLFFLIIVIIIAKAYASPIPQRKNNLAYRPLYGVSYSFEQAGWYGLDLRKSYAALLDQVKVDWVRLPFFWDLMVDESGNLKIDDLKFAIEEAQRRNIKIIVAIGAKVPYYPEFHLPSDVKAQLKFGETISSQHKIAPEILAVDKKVVSELATYDNIAYWQVENEPFLGNVNGLKISPDLIAEEVRVVRESDPLKRPIILNHPAGWFLDNDWKKLLPILRQGDVFATNAYFKTQGIDLVSFKLAGSEFHIPWPKSFIWPVQSWLFLSPNFASIKRQVENNGNDLWVLEMQSEPYIRKKTDAAASKFSFTPGDIKLGNNFLKSYGIKSVGLWGAHFWQYKQANGDNSWINAVKSITN